uniref:Uncharacterized protein n=1 Tax=Rhizochromulina marina TaxID=1034831 RepID=A0A7S2WME7_9STRA|mmetsp:Transcript_27728/g.81078  ORF Transcript_27728/g.81078 Transcript_27728/m.81078 type:complete len:230 (+) Transcript_27728:171-860(+)
MNEILAQLEPPVPRSALENTQLRDRVCADRAWDLFLPLVQYLGEGSTEGSQDALFAAAVLDSICAVVPARELVLIASESLSQAADSGPHQACLEIARSRVVQSLLKFDLGKRAPHLESTLPLISRSFVAREGADPATETPSGALTKPKLVEVSTLLRPLVEEEKQAREALGWASTQQADPACLRRACALVTMGLSVGSQIDLAPDLVQGHGLGQDLAPGQSANPHSGPW